jgi:F0F1-type ATP synthase membrane subunit c/vacuolar-type H+-ATPase subunit K
VAAHTAIDAGPLLALVGGLMIVVGSLVVAVAASRAAARATGARTRRPRHGGAAPPSPA